MAKRLLEFDKEIIDLREIKGISSGTSYNKKDHKVEFTIEINSKIPEGKIPIPIYIFKYATEEFRDNRLEMLKIALEGEDDIEFILT